MGLRCGCPSRFTMPSLSVWLVKERSKQTAGSKRNPRTNKIGQTLTLYSRVSTFKENGNHAVKNESERKKKSSTDYPLAMLPACKSRPEVTPSDAVMSRGVAARASSQLGIIRYGHIWLPPFLFLSSRLLRACFLLQRKIVCGKVLRKQVNRLHSIISFSVSNYAYLRTIRNHTLD